MLVRDQQIALYRLGFDPQGIDGVDGPNTCAARAEFMKAQGAASLGDNSLQFEGLLLAAAAKLPLFIQAKNFTPAGRPHSAPIDVIVIHTMEAPEKPKQVIAVARWFGGLLAPTYPAPQASAHYCVDDTDVVQCVLEKDCAWHAPGANHNGIGIEHSGFASQSPADWDDAYSRAVLKKSAELVAALCVRFCIPIQKIGPAELAAGARGICGHIDCTNAFSGGRGHVDPGPNFPYDAYLAMVRSFAGAP